LLVFRLVGNGHLVRSHKASRIHPEQIHRERTRVHQKGFTLKGVGDEREDLTLIGKLECSPLGKPKKSLSFINSWSS